MKLWHSYLKEIKLASKGFYFYIEIIMALLILTILMFVIPENMTNVQEEFLHFDLPADMVAFYESALLEKDLDGQAEIVTYEEDDREITALVYETKDSRTVVFEEKEDMILMTEKEVPYIGADLVYQEVDGTIFYDYYLQGYESDRLKNLLKIFHINSTEGLDERVEAVPSRTLELGHEYLSTRESALPPLLTLNGSLMGVFIVAAYIFLDKEAGVIKAYAVTASPIWQYLLSKVLVLTTVTIVTTTAIIIPVMGGKVAYGYYLLLLITSGFFASALGLVISTFFDTMTKSFSAIYTIMMAMLLPVFSYYLPSWNPLWIRALPTYYLILGFKETILAKGDMGFVVIASLVHLAIGIVLFVWANHRFKKSLVY